VNNIFLTGEKGVGKSTIINRFAKTLDFLPTGFQTLMCYKDECGPYTLVIRPYKVDLEYVKGSKPEGDDYSIVAFRETQEIFMKVNKDAFDFAGVRILRKSLENEQARLIIMDELGFMEKDAIMFQAEVFKCLDSEIPVLGVLRAGSIPFLDAISEREDVLVLEVTDKNRDQLFSDMATTKKYAQLAQCWK
jgi:Predicted nucleotide kinase